MRTRRQTVSFLIVVLLLIDVLGALWLWHLWPRRPSPVATRATPRTVIPPRPLGDAPPPKPRPAPTIPLKDR
jgi:hypothetical protein